MTWRRKRRGYHSVRSTETIESIERGRVMVWLIWHDEAARHSPILSACATTKLYMTTTPISLGAHQVCIIFSFTVLFRVDVFVRRCRLSF